jgi:hypothetical protein
MASPAQQAPAPQIVDVPLALFGGMHTGVAAPDLPEGLSPDNQDMAFVPGDCLSRPCLSKLWTPSVGSVAMLYCKTYLQPNGDPLTLALDAEGNLWAEDINDSPGTATNVATVTAGISALSATAFGREYIAFSDLLTGQWPPLQYNGTEIERVTQDGPGFGPTAANFSAPSATLGGSTGASYTIATATASDPTSYPGNTIYATLTIVTTAANAAAVGETVALSGITFSSLYGYPGDAEIVEVLSSTSFKINNFWETNAGAPVPAGTGGTAQLLAPALIRLNGVVTATATAAHGFQPGNQVQIQGVSDSVSLGGGIASIALDGNGNCTVTTTNPHGIPEQSQVIIEGVSSPTGVGNFNGQFQVASVPSPTSFTYPLGGVAGSGSGGNVYDVWNVTAFVQSVPSTTTFTYTDIGPNRSVGTIFSFGTASIVGQISPGAHRLVTIFLTDQGALTRPSPPTTFYANGGQQAALSGIAIGHSNVVARLIGATGSGGDNFFVIPDVPQVGPQIVGTWTVIPDNTSTTAVLDFSDNVLFDSIAIDQTGNDLFDQRTLIAPVGFYAYASRLFCWYDYNAIVNLLNMTLAAGAVWTEVTGTVGSGASSGSGTAWNNPTNIETLGSYADVSVAPSGTSAGLYAETFGLTVPSPPTQVAVAVPYYYTGGGASRTETFSYLDAQLLKAGSPFGPVMTVLLPPTPGGTGRGSAASPLTYSFVFRNPGLSASDIANAGFGAVFTLSAGMGATHVYVGQINITASTADTSPAGWSVPTTGTTALVSSAFPGIQQLFQCTSAGGANDCMITQPAYQDAYGTAILTPLTNYQWRVFLSYAAGITAGNLVAALFSPTQGLLATASVAIGSVAFTGFAIASFSAEMPAVIPSDVVLEYYLQNVPSGDTVSYGETSLVYAQQPFMNNVASVSYVENPEAFAATTGVIGSADDPSPIRCFSIQKTTTLLKSASGTHNFQDNDYEPDQWVVNNVSRSVGACSIRAGDPGQFGTGDAAEDWDVTANQNGLYLTAGGDFWKISQELDKGDPAGSVPTWQDVNWSHEQTIVVKNDPKKHRIYVLAPIQGAAQPNVLWVLDYKELDTAVDLYTGPSLKIGITGKMLSTDKTRKWSRWNISANCADILIRPGNDKSMTFAGGTRNGEAYGNLYKLNDQKYTDDDYGQMFPYYTTYGFVNHEQEQMLNLGTDRKLIRKYCAFVTGIGYITITPLVDSLNNPLPATSPRVLNADSNISNLQNTDLEWTVGVRGERIFHRISVFPLPGTTDVQMRLQKLIVHMMKDPVIYHRSSAL